MMDRFLDKVFPEPNTGCWLWGGTVDQSGYGHFGIGSSRCEKAHRVSFKLFNGPIPHGLIVCHNCDVPGCVNPDHLFLGTSKDNAADRDKKGRAALGEKNGKSKITADIARFIKRSDLSERKIATLLGVHRGTVNAVRSGRTWAHVGKGGTV